MMVHPLFKSRNGARLYRELPEVMRLYDTRDPDAGRLGELEQFLFGFGHMLDRYDATLEQFYADGFLEPTSPGGTEIAVQGWMLPYIAQIFGVELVAPDPDSRRAELAASIWIQRRRATRAAIDAAAETLTGLAAVVVDGRARVLRTPRLGALMTHREAAGLWHPSDAAILGAPLPPFDAATHLAGFAATRPARHAGLAVGMPDGRRRMRAVVAPIGRPDADTRPDADGALIPFVVADRRGVPCFPDTHEDRGLRLPDMRAPRENRPRGGVLVNPDWVTLFLRPPDGMFAPGMTEVPTPPVLTDGEVLTPPPPAPPDHYVDAGQTLTLTAANAGPDGRHSIEGLRFAGTVLVEGGVDVDMRGCAIGRLEFDAGYDGVRFHARSCLFGAVAADGFPVAMVDGTPRPAITLEYVTVIGAADLALVQASDCLFLGALSVIGDGSAAMMGCLRYSRVPPGFDRSRVHMYRSSFGTASLLARPCLPDGLGGLETRAPGFGEPGFGVLSDRNPPAVRGGAEDGGELGAYHDDHHLARVAAAVLKARGTAPAGRRIFATYDTRLTAPAPVV